MSTEGICVCVRARPLNERELRGAVPGKGWLIDPYNNTIQQDVQGKQAMNFDRVFDETADNVQVYNDAAKRIVESGLDGMNGTIFAYGQTSSGKTYSMGSIMKMGFHDIFSHIKKDKQRKYSVKASYIEIYNENITDLLDASKTNLKVQDSERGPYIPGLTERDVSTVAEVLALHELGSNSRHVGATLMNDQSSRSHTIFQLTIHSEPILKDTDARPSAKATEGEKRVRGVLKATVNFVDLAGSERASSTGAQGQRLKEGAHINKSLLTLGAVIRKLADMGSGAAKNVHVPFRDSKLTRILQPALGGNSRTTMLCCITQAANHSEETIGTLGFARRAKLIKNRVGVNELLDDKMLIAKLKEEIASLKARLAQSAAALASLPTSDSGDGSNTLMLDDSAILAAFKQKLDEDDDDDHTSKRARVGDASADGAQTVQLADREVLLALNAQNRALHTRLQQLAVIAGVNKDDMENITQRVAMSIANANGVLIDDTGMGMGMGAIRVNFGTQTLESNMPALSTAALASQAGADTEANVVAGVGVGADDDGDDDESEDRVIIARKSAVKRALLNIDVDSDCEDFDEEMEAFFERPVHAEVAAPTAIEEAVEEDVVVDILKCENLSYDSKVAEQIAHDIEHLQVMSHKSLRNKVSDMTKRIYELNFKCEQLQSTVTALEEAQQQQREIDNEVLFAISSEVDDVHEVYGQVMGNFRLHLGSIRAEYEERLQKAQNANIQLKSSFEEVCEEMEALYTAKEQVEAAVVELEGKLTRAYQDIEEMKTQLASERAVNRGFEETGALTEARVTELVHERENLQQELNTMVQRAKEYQNQADELQRSVQEKQVELTNLRAEIGAGSNLASIMQGDMEKLQQALDKAQEDARKANEYVLNVENTLNKERATSAALQSEVDSLRMELQETKTMSDIARSNERAKWQEREDELMAQVELLAERIEEAEALNEQLHSEFQQKLKKSKELIAQNSTHTEAEKEALLATAEARLEKELANQKGMYEKIIADGKATKEALMAQLEELDVELQEERAQREKITKVWNEEKEELSLLCDELEARVTKERDLRTELEKDMEKHRIDAASLRAVLDEVRTSHSKDEDAIERRIASITADKDKHIESLERRVQSAEDRTYRDQKLLNDAREEVAALKGDVQTLKSQLATVRAQKEDAEHQLLAAQEELQRSMEDLNASSKKKLQEIKINAEVSLDTALREQEEMFMSKFEQLRVKHKQQLENREKEIIARFELTNAKLVAAEEDYFALKESYEKLKNNAQLEAKRQLDAHKQEWQRAMAVAVKTESQRAEEQRSMNNELKEEIEDLKDKLRAAHKQLAQKEDSIQQRLQSLQEKQEAYMTEKLQKYKAQLKKSADSLKTAQANEMEASAEVEKLKSELERQRAKADALARELREKDAEISQQNDAIRELERRQPSAKVAAQLARTRPTRSTASLDDDDSALLDQTTWMRPSARRTIKTLESRPSAIAEEDDVTQEMPMRSPLRPASSARINGTTPQKNSLGKVGGASSLSGSNMLTRKALKPALKSQAPADDTSSLSSRVKPAVSAYVYKGASFDDGDNTMALDAFMSLDGISSRRK